MKRKSNFLPNTLCLLLCGCLVTGAVFGSGFFSSAFMNMWEGYFAIKNELTGEITQASSYSVAESEQFSPVGFGGGYKTVSLTDTPDDILKLMTEAEKMYAGFTETGTIKEEQYCTSTTGNTYGIVDVNNKAGGTFDIKKMLNTAPSYGEIKKDEPYILIYHTHTTEGYELLDKGWYSDDYNSRTKESAKNMVRVGDALAEALEAAGYNVIHDTTVYDTAYTGAYDRSRKAVEKYLEEYPSIVLTLDVHRDAIHYDGNVKGKPTAVINGKKAAQVMIITGCEGSGIENFPDWQENFIFAVHLQNAVEERFEGLMRPVFFCHRKYNMDVTPCSLLLEFGTDANTLEEAVYSGTLVGTALGAMLDKG